MIMYESNFYLVRVLPNCQEELAGDKLSRVTVGSFIYSIGR